MQILILDDHALIASGVAGYLGKMMPAVNFIAVNDQQALLKHLMSYDATALCIIDYWLDDNGASNLLGKLSLSHKNVPVLVISGDNDPLLVKKIQGLGAKGFIGKGEQPDQLLNACTSILSGSDWFPSLKIKVAKRQYQFNVTPEELGLTNRQGQVLELLLEGLPNKIIARKLSISESTVKEHIGYIFERLNIYTRPAIFAYFHERKLNLVVE